MWLWCRRSGRCASPSTAPRSRASSTSAKATIAAAPSTPRITAVPRRARRGPQGEDLVRRARLHSCIPCTRASAPCGEMRPRQPSPGRLGVDVPLLPGCPRFERVRNCVHPGPESRVTDAPSPRLCRRGRRLKYLAAARIVRRTLQQWPLIAACAVIAAIAAFVAASAKTDQYESFAKCRWQRPNLVSVFLSEQIHHQRCGSSAQDGDGRAALPATPRA